MSRVPADYAMVLEVLDEEFAEGGDWCLGAGSVVGELVFAYLAYDEVARLRIGKV
jgi:hypothetical protein